MKNSTHLLACYKFSCPSFSFSAGHKHCAGSKHLKLRVYGLG